MTNLFFEEINEQISDFIEDEERDLKFILGDKLDSIQFEVTPTIAYDYLNIDVVEDYSFHHNELHSFSSEEYPNKSDYNIYFEKVKSFCSQSLNTSLNCSHHSEHLKLVNPNSRLLNVVKRIFNVDRITDEAMPQFGELGLYTNKNDNKAPRIFFFIGNVGIVYILFYDPFHSIFNSRK